MNTVSTHENHSRAMQPSSRIAFIMFGLFLVCHAVLPAAQASIQTGVMDRNLESNYVNSEFMGNHSDFIFNQFDPLYGNLNSVRLMWDLQTHTTLQITNPYSFDATLSVLTRAYIDHSPRLILSSLGTLYELLDQETRVVQPHETIVIEKDVFIPGYALDITDSNYLTSFVGNGSIIPISI